MNEIFANYKLLTTLIILVGGAFFFFKEILRSDLTALLIMALLVASGVISPREAVLGFSNEATITVACMLIISAAFVKSGTIALISNPFIKLLGRGANFSVILISSTVGLISAFINNTAAVAVFMPLTIRAAKMLKIDKRKLLMPLSYASIFGGTCTLIGTSTNILANSIYREKLGREFSMLEFSSIGIILFISGVIYLLLFGLKALGPNIGSEIEATQPIFYTEVVILEHSPSSGKLFFESQIYKDFGAEIIEIRSEKGGIKEKSAILRPKDRIRLICSIEKINSLKDRIGISILNHDDSLSSSTHEIIIPTNSDLIGKSLKNIINLTGGSFRPLAMKQKGILIESDLVEHRVRAGDILVVNSSTETLVALEKNEGLIVLNNYSSNEVDLKKIVASAAVVAGIVLASGFNLISIMGASLIGCILLLLTNVINLDEAYEALDSKVLILLGSLLSLGLALEKSGAISLISNNIVQIFGTFSPFFIVSILYLLTSLLTEVISNNATAVILVPLAIQISQTLGYSEKPFILAVMMAGSASFMTPVGYQTNTLIYSTGSFTFKDFLKVGAPLNILFWLLASFLIPYFFPF